MMNGEKTQDLERILHIRDVQKILGRSHASIYRDINNGILTAPIKIGAGWRIGWPSGEIAAIRRALVEGRTQCELKRLVSELHSNRQQS